MQLWLEHKTKIGKTIFRFGVVQCISMCEEEERGWSEVNLCMQHNEANAIIYKPVGDMDFARYSFCILSTALHTHIFFSITTQFLKINFHIFESIEKISFENCSLYLSLTMSKFISGEREGKKSISWTAGELDFEYRDCHTERIKVFNVRTPEKSFC